MIVVIVIAIMGMLLIELLNMFMLAAIVVKMGKWDGLIKATLGKIEFYFSDVSD